MFAQAVSPTSVTWTATDLPPGVTIGPATGVIAGQIAMWDSIGYRYRPTITATANGLSASQSFMWTILHIGNTAPVVDDPGTQINTVGDIVNVPLSASDAEPDILTYSAVNLPRA
jgi:hypothetical protein